MMDSALIKDLDLIGSQCSLNVQWFAGRGVQEPATIVDLRISGAGMRKKHSMRRVYAVDNLCLPTQRLSENDLQNSTGRPALLAALYLNVKPQILIGLDHCHLGIPSEAMRLREGGPFAVNTELGWVVFGPSAELTPVTFSPCLLTSAVDEQNMHEMVVEYFSTENFGVRPAPVIESEADMRAKNILQATTRRVNDRFQTGLLGKSDDVQLPPIYAMAKNRLTGIERKMNRDDVFAAAYKAIIESYVNKGYARKLSPAEAAVMDPKTWYLPHFAVTNPNKPGKIRLVFDAAATVDGTSLNSYLLKGPQEYQPMPSVLFNFRVGAIAVCEDIREMFHQVMMLPEDRCAQRFLWRDGATDRPPDVYEMTVMTFGATCSPCAAKYVKTVNALEHQTKQPRAVKAIVDHDYVDDYVDSYESVPQAIETSQQVRKIHKSAGFELHKLTSNSTEVLSALSGAAETMPDGYNQNILTTEKVLGMYWQPQNDNFKYQLKFHGVSEEIITGDRCPTKRELLSIVMSVFDPLGFLSHFLITAKLLVRELWRHNIGWDEPLPDHIYIAWVEWRKSLQRVDEVRIPRYYFSKGAPKQLQLHIFVNASTQAFAATAYWRAVSDDNEVEVAFVCAKTRGAPLKLMSVPRLELQAAVLGTRMMQMIIEEHTIAAARCVLWSDSKTVLKWIGSENRRYKPFVAHRIAEILATTEVSNWRWIPTQDNVADEATRSKYQIDFSPSSRWFQGPKFLRQAEELWPASVTAINREDFDEEELTSNFALLAVSCDVVDLSRFSSFNRLKRAYAWVIRKIVRTDGIHGLTATELDASEAVLCRLVQAEKYSEELSLVKKGECVSKSSALYKSTPIIDEQEVLRVGGRVEAASYLPIYTRRPIILPPDHAMTRLIVAHHHQRMKHQNVEAAICEVNRRYSIPRLRQVMRSVIAGCCVCRIARVVPFAPLMGQLPEDRLTPYVRPFTYTGIDYFGLLSVTIGRRIEKRWIALFTCLSVRAIHLEVAYDLSTDACILAMRNFMNRRGVPLRIRSDNGKNFVGADNEARAFAEVFDCVRIQSELSAKGIEWIFNCPSHPSAGGVWERMVQCVKRVLRHTLKEISPREYTLQSFIIEAENVVNSRPLTHLPISPDQEEPLTPNHFLLGSANTAQTLRVDQPPDRPCALRKQ